MEQKIYYLDNAATTKMFEDVLSEGVKYYKDEFYNPSSVYYKSVEVKRCLSEAKKTLLNCLGADDGEIIFTGSATEANNMVVFSQKNVKGKRFLFGAGEHPSVLECAKELLKRGYDVEFIPLSKEGSVDMESYKQMVSCGNVAFVSVQHTSNETGAVNPIAKLVKLARRFNKDVLFHSDGVQAFSKFGYSVLDLDVDYYTISAHKIYGAKGVGALYIKKGVKVNPLIFGGGQELGLRSGTENVFGIMTFKMCAEKVVKEIDKNYNKVQNMRKELLEELTKNGIDYVIHGEGVPHTMNICLSKKVRGETLVHALEKQNIFVSTGSACSSTKNYNTTLEAMGVPAEEILCSIRISFSPYMDFDAKFIAKTICEQLKKLEVKSYE